MILSILYGGITNHYLGSNLPYCNRINNNSFGTIHNEYVIALVGSEQAKIGFIKGKDSACGNIFGPIATYKLLDNLDFVAGGYKANYSDFDKLGMRPISWYGVTPVIGLDYRIPLYKNKDIGISIDNLISYGIITHSLRVDF